MLDHNQSDNNLKYNECINKNPTKMQIQNQVKDTNATQS